MNRLVNRDLNPLLSTLPVKFQHFRPEQVECVAKAVAAYDRGERLVVIQAPTGIGKTLIAETVRRELETRGSYVCHNKDLQSQFYGDFMDVAGVVYGRNNYMPTGRNLVEVTCEDCDYSKDKDCSLCLTREGCPYQVAKNQAIRSKVAVVNSAYWLSEVQGLKSFIRGRGLTVFDEADTLEGVLMGRVEVFVSERRQQRHGIEAPRRMTKEESWVEWAEEALERLAPEVKRLMGIALRTVKQEREFKTVAGLQEKIEVMKRDIEQGSPWVYTGGAGSDRRVGGHVSFKPVKVAAFGQKMIWDNDKRFLLMSGSVISPDELLNGLGWVE